MLYLGMMHDELIKSMSTTVFVT